jgi:hypothetical protein
MRGGATLHAQHKIAYLNNMQPTNSKPLQRGRLRIDSPWRAGPVTGLQQCSPHNTQSTSPEVAAAQHPLQTIASWMALLTQEKVQAM